MQLTLDGSSERRARVAKSVRSRDQAAPNGPATVTATLRGLLVAFVAVVVVAMSGEAAGAATAPTAQSSSTTNGLGSAVPTTCTVTRPLGVANADVLVGILAYDGSGTATDPTAFTRDGSATSALTNKLWVSHHVVTDAAAEPSTYTWTVSAAQRMHCHVLRVSGADVSAPIDATATAGSGRVAPALTTTGDNRLLVHAVHAASSTAWITPAPLVELYSAMQGTGNGRTVAAGVEVAATSGAVPSRTWTGGSDVNAYVLVAIRPAADDPPETTTTSSTTTTTTPVSGGESDPDLTRATEADDATTWIGEHVPGGIAAGYLAAVVVVITLSFALIAVRRALRAST